ncbi:MAG TPA: hypothetical protein VGB54_11075 [Allosphingosinicella sp.]|jgi:hypothetical protein
MDRADLEMALDIGRAAAAEASNSIIIKTGVLPRRLQLLAIFVAVQLVANKSAALRRTIPGAELIGSVLDQAAGLEEQDLRERLTRGAFGFETERS